MLGYSCPCGFSGMVRVGCGTPDIRKNTKTKLTVAAYDPEKETIIGISQEEAQNRALMVYPDPFAYNPIKWIVERDESAAPLGPDARFECPICHQNKLEFKKVGCWD